MPRKESLYPLDWFRISDKDLRRVEYLLDLQDAEATGFYLQQGVEKFIKAYLLSRAWKLERIHDLESLLNETLIHEPSFEKFRSVCQKITDFYFIERVSICYCDRFNCGRCS